MWATSKNPADLTGEQKTSLAEIATTNSTLYWASTSTARSRTPVAPAPCIPGADLARLNATYQKIIVICEAEGVDDPDRLGWEPSADPDLRWLVQESKSAMVGFPEILAKDRQKPGAMVVPSSRSGVSDDSLSGFGTALSAAFRESTKIESHFEKLARADADERHLFIPLHDSALPFSIGVVLMFGETLPSQPPRVPDYITHLWLAPAFSRRVLLWSRTEGWRNVFPYDSPRGGSEGAHRCHT